jgi:hypothetical protein
VILAVPTVPVFTKARRVDAFNAGAACNPVYNSSPTFLYELKALVGPGPTVVTWSAGAQTLFNDGVSNWERLRNDANTAPEIDFVANTSSVSRWQILRGVPGSTSDINGDGQRDGVSAACIAAGSGSRIIQVASREDQPTSFRRTSVHETGHGLGVSHTGICDSRPANGSSTNMHPLTSSWPYQPFCGGGPPVVSTNCEATSNSDLPSADDYAAMMYRRSGSGQQVIANPTAPGSPPVSQSAVRAKYKSNGTSNGKVVVRKRHITNAGDTTCTAGDVIPGPWDPNTWTSIGPTIDVGSYQFNIGGNASNWASLGPSSATVANASGNTSSIFLEVEVVNTTGGSLWVDNVALQFTG